MKKAASLWLMIRQETVIMLRTLTRPDPAITDELERGRVSALSAVTLAFIPLMFITTFVVLPLARTGTMRMAVGEVPFYAGLGSIAAMVTAYVFSRTRHYSVSTMIFVGYLLIAVYVSGTLTDLDMIGRNLILVWLGLVLLMSNLFLSLRVTIILGLLCMVAVITLPLVTPFFDWSNVVGLMSFMVAITGYIFASRRVQSQLEAERTRLMTVRQHELESRVDERTQELREANERLIELGAIKDEFIGNVSHELRTPITNLVLYHQLLQDKPDKADMYIATLKRETVRLQHIIEGLLDLARLDQGMMAFEPESVDLSGLIREFITDRERIVASHKLTLDVSVDESLPPVQADPRLIWQVLSVLLTNAINYTPAGGQIVVATTCDDTAECAMAGFTVRDTGPGIPPEELTHLFERFFRGKAGKQSGIAGTGLGLAIVREIVDLHEGQITVVNVPDDEGGVKFDVWFPVKGEDD